MLTTATAPELKYNSPVRSTFDTDVKAPATTVVAG